MPADKETITAFFREEFPQLPYQIVSVGEQSSTIRHQVGHSDLRPGGTISGPSLFALADSALYVAVLGEIGIVPLAVTTNVTINFMRKPSADHDLEARCTLIKMGRNLAVGDVFIYSDAMPNKPVAHAVGTYAIPPQPKS